MTPTVAKYIKQRWKSFAQNQQACWLFSLFWLGVICWIAFLWHLGSTGLIDETEPLFAEAARQMLKTGDWLTPYFNGDTRFDKPPLIYWLMAIGYRLIGVNEWAVRFPSALAAIALTVFCFFSLRYFGWATPAAAVSRRDRSLWLSAWLGSGLVALNVQTLIWARIGVSDMLLSGCMGTALLCFFWGYARGGRETVRNSASHAQCKTHRKGGSNYSLSFFVLPNSWYLAFYVLTALAVLTKGPVGAVLPGIIIGTFLLYIGRFWEVIREMGIIWGGIIFLSITLPWYVLIILRHGSDYIDTFFGHHNFERFTSVVNGHSAPWYYYFFIVFGLLAPWSVYLPLAIFRLRFWRRFWWRQQPRYAQLSLFACCWFLCIFLFFSFSVTKLPSYVLPLVPAAAILVALLFSGELTQPLTPAQKNWGLVISGAINVLLLLALAAAFVYSPDLLGNDPAIGDESELLAKSGFPWRGGLTWGVTAIVCLVLLSRRRWQSWLISANLAGLVALVIFTLVPFLFLVDQLRQFPLRAIAATIPQVQQVEEEIWMVGFNKPSVVFYANRPVKFFKTEDRAINYLKGQTVPPAKSDTLLIISREKEIKELELEKNYQKLDQESVYLLVRVAKQKAFRG